MYYHLSSLVIIAYHWFHWLSLVSLIIIDYHWLSLVLIAYHWLSMVIIGYHWLSSIIIGFHWLSWIFKDYLKIQKGESLTDSLTDWNQEVQAYLKKVLGGLLYSCCQMYLKGCSHGPWWPHCGGRSRGLSYCKLNQLTSYTEGRTRDPWVLDDAGLLGWQGQDWWSDWARPMVPYWVDPSHKWCLKLYIFNMLKAS